MIALLVAYAAVACVCCGVFFAVTPDSPKADVIMAAIWPVTLLLIIGFNLGSSAKGRLS